jgi:alkylated DNA repair dioxygenase AlkB
MSTSTLLRGPVPSSPETPFSCRRLASGESEAGASLIAQGFEEHSAHEHSLYVGKLPGPLQQRFRDTFEALWSLHPTHHHEIKQPFTGRRIPLRRWQQAYERDYAYTGSVNEAAALPELLAPALEWAKSTVDPRLDGLLLNWYQAEEGHYIGPHRDSTQGLVVGTPIVTISLGAERLFGIQPYRGSGRVGFTSPHGTVFVLPWETNLGVRHEVPHFQRDRGQRISITLRAFQ